MPHASAATQTPAAVRFLNNTAEPVVLIANGTELFRQVEAGSVTEYAEVRDRSVTFRLGGTSEATELTDHVVDGGRYTLTARAAPQSEPTLRLVREADPGTAIGDK